MSAWKAFYEGREGHEYREYVRERYAPFIDAINHRVKPRDLVLELGTGTGTITSLLAEGDWERRRCCATDVDPEMLMIAKQRMSALKLDVAIYQESAIEGIRTMAEVVHSHGMLEHFDDDTIRGVIARYSSAHTQVHYVPGLYPEPTLGDERLMSVDAWWRICKPSQILTFNEGLDYALIFER